LTKGRKKARLLAVQCLNSIHNYSTEDLNQDLRVTHIYKSEQWPEYIWTLDEQEVQAHDNRITVPIPQEVGIKSLKLVINTPLRLQRRGRIVGPRDMDIRILISGLARRIALIMEFHSNDSRWGERVPHLIALAEYVQND